MTTTQTRVQELLNKLEEAVRRGHDHVIMDLRIEILRLILN